MKRAVMVAALALAACKPSGPTKQELEAVAKQKKEHQGLCARSGPRDRWDSLARIATEVKKKAPLKEDKLPARSIRFRELHLKDGEETATTDVNWLADFEGPKRGIIGSCVFRQVECRDDDTSLEDALKGCASIDSYVVIRTLTEEKPKPGEVDGKYTGGFMTGEAYVYSLVTPDGGFVRELGAVTFDARLSGEVEVYRDSTTAQLEYALNEALRRSALRQLEALLTR